MAAVPINEAFGIGYRVAFLGTIAMFVFIVVLVIFAKLTQTGPKRCAFPMAVLMRSFLLLFVVSAFLLFHIRVLQIPC